MAYIPTSSTKTASKGYIPTKPQTTKTEGSVSKSGDKPFQAKSLSPGVVGRRGVVYPDFSSGYGASFKVEKYSGKPFLQKSENFNTTVLPDRVAQTFDVTKPQKLENFTTTRMPVSASQKIRDELGATTFQQLDHLFPVSLGGSNEIANLRLQDEVNGKQPLVGFEAQIWRKALKGEISVLDAWQEMAQAKGIALKESQTKYIPTSLGKKIYEGIQGFAAGTVPVQIAARLQGGESFGEAVSEAIKRHPWGGTAEEDVADAGIVNEEYKKLLARGMPKEKALAQARVNAIPKSSRGQRVTAIAMGAVDAGGGMPKTKVSKVPKAPKSVTGAGKTVEPLASATEELTTKAAKGRQLSQLGKSLDASLDDAKVLAKSQVVNVENLNITPEAKNVIKQTVEEMKPRIEEIAGKTLTNKEAMSLADSSSKVLTRAVGQESTKEWEAAMLKARRDLAAAAQSGKVDQAFVENLLVIKTQGTDIARKLQSLSIKADPLAITSKEAILDAVLKVNSNVDEITNAAKGVDFNDFRQASEFYRKFIKPTSQEWLDLIRYNSMLTSPNTHIINVFSNFVNTSVVAPIEKSLTGTLDFLQSKFTGAPRKYFVGESGAYLKAYYKNIGNAAREFADVMRGKTAVTNLDTRNIPLATKGLKGKVAETLSFPLKLLEGMDRFFMKLGQSAEEGALSLREARGVRVGLKGVKAEQAAAYRLFREELFSDNQGMVLDAVDRVTQNIQGLRNSENKIVSTVAKFTVPFLRTPMNIFKQGIEYSPAGFSTLVGAQNKTEQLSKAILGSAVFAGAATLLTSGRLTWGEPVSSTEKAKFKAAGMQPYSVRIGDKWYSYQKLAPGVAFPIAMVAALDDLIKNKEADDNFADMALTAIAKYGDFLADQSYAKSIGDLLNFAKGGEAGVTRVASNYAQQLIPFRALGGWLARLSDATQRKVDNQAPFVEQQIQQLMLNIPGLSQRVPARVDSRGNPIPANSRVVNAVSPIRISKENSELRKLLEQEFDIKKEAKEVQAQKDAGKEAFVPKYEEIQRLVKEEKFDEAQAMMNDLSDDEYALYKSLKASDKRKESSSIEAKIYPKYKEIQDLVSQGREDDAKFVLDSLSDEEYAAYKRLKNKLQN